MAKIWLPGDSDFAGAARGWAITPFVKPDKVRILDATCKNAFLWGSKDDNNQYPGPSGTTNFVYLNQATGKLNTLEIQDSNLLTKRYDNFGGYLLPNGGSVFPEYQQLEPINYSQHTFVSVVKPINITSKAILEGSAGKVIQLKVMSYSAGTLIVRAINNASWTAAADETFYNIGQDRPLVFVYTFNSNTNTRNLFVNGQKAERTNFTGADPSPLSTYNIDLVADGAGDFGHYAFIHFNRVLSDAEALAICKNPFNNPLIRPSANDTFFIVGTDAAGGTEISVTTGAITIAGTNASISQVRNVSVTTGAISIQKVNAAIEVNRNVSITTGAINVAGINAAIEINRNISVTTGAITVAGFNAVVQQAVGQEVSVTTGALSVAATNASISQQNNVVVTTGALTVQRTNAALEVNRNVSVTAGALSIAGVNAVVDQQVTGETNIIVTTGALTVTGTAAVINQITELGITTGAITVGAVNASIAAQTAISVSTGALSIAGTNAGIIAGVGISVSTGSLQIVGYNATVSGLIWTEIPDVSTTWTEIP
jgi:hypothetical protein